MYPKAAIGSKMFGPKNGVSEMTNFGDIWEIWVGPPQWAAISKQSIIGKVPNFSVFGPKVYFYMLEKQLVK